jgi:hypothetical protein
MEWSRRNLILGNISPTSQILYILEALEMQRLDQDFAALTAVLTVGSLMCSSTILAKRYKIRVPSNRILESATNSPTNSGNWAHEIEGHRLAKAIESKLKQKPRLQKKDRQPDPSSDR